MRKSLILCLVLVATSVRCSKPTVAPPVLTNRPIAEVNRVLIVSIDGLRPDVALRADAPRLRALLRTGCFTFWARTTEMSVTLPSHTSMLTGVTPRKHKVTWNGDLSGPQIYPAYPTLFELATKAGYSTCMVAGKTKFSALAKPGTLTWNSVRATNDASVAAAAVSMIADHQPQVMFVHFPGADVAGHGLGWGSPAQVLAVERIDALLGSILDALDAQGLTDSTLVIISADHGGAGRSHGPEDPRSRHIPWISSNPHIRQGYDLTQNSRLVVNTEDTFATACVFLGINPGAGIDGKPVLDIVSDRELLQRVK